MTKKIFIVVLFFTILTVNSQAQNLLGYSVKDVRENLDSQGLIINSGYTSKSNIYYLTGQDNNMLRVYYFDFNNQCELYLAFIPGTKEDIIRALIDKEWYKVGNYLYKDDFKVQVLYDEDLEYYYMEFTFK